MDIVTVELKNLKEELSDNSLQAIAENMAIGMDIRQQLGTAYIHRASLRVCIKQTYPLGGKETNYWFEK